MAGSAGSSERLREALEGFGADVVDELIAEARADALERATSILSDAMTRSLVERALASLQGAPDEPGSAAVADESPTLARDEPAGDAIYVYGVAPVGSGLELASQEEGVATGNRPSALEHVGLAAITSVVSLAEFGEEELHENLNDVVWLEQTARRHEGVLAAALQETTVVPFRLCTIYRDSDHVREMLERERPVFMDALERLSGKTEWGVKMFAAPGALEREAAARDDEAQEDVTASPGRAYMHGKRRQAQAREEADRIAEEWADSVHARIAAIAREGLLNPLQSAEASGRDGEMILNGVYLVDDDRSQELALAVDELADRYGSQGASVELTGPWPPYNFVKGSIEAAR